MNHIINQKNLTGILILAVALVAGCEKMDWGSSQSTRADADDAYTIMLFTHEGPDHLSSADAHKSRISEAVDWSGLFVVNKEKTSSLYWGRYKTQKSASRNLRKAKAFISPASKAHIYIRAKVVSLPGKDQGPPEWNLENAPPGMKWSVKVGMYYDIPNRNYFGRKGEAVEVCRQLRLRGEEGYYFHGPQRSGVFIGAFPPSSITENQIQVIHPKSGHRSLRTDFIVTDQRIKRILREYPDLVICGSGETTTVYDPKSGKRKTYRQPSSIIFIPGRKDL